MKNVLFVLQGSLVLLPQLASAGPLYGTVRIGQAPAADVRIAVACPRFSPPGQPPSRGTADAATDARGSFSLRVPASGRCEMRAQKDNRVGGAFEVFVSDNPMRFDFVVDGAMNRVR